MKDQENFVNHIRPRFVPNGVLSVFYTFCLGGLSFLAFVLIGIINLEIELATIVS